MRIVLIGQAAFAKDTLSALIEKKENVVGVFWKSGIWQSFIY